VVYRRKTFPRSPSGRRLLLWWWVSNFRILGNFFFFLIPGSIDS
jgi:hypothetical protein